MSSGWFEVKKHYSTGNKAVGGFHVSSAWFNNTEHVQTTAANQAYGGVSHEFSVAQPYRTSYYRPLGVFT